MIDKEAWRIPLVYFDEMRFQPSGFVHVRCCFNYFETKDLIERVGHFAPHLSEQDLDEIRAELNEPEPPADA